MANDTTVLLDLPGLVVDRVERDGAGQKVVHLLTKAERARCPACGTVSDSAKAWVRTHPRDLEVGGHAVRLC